MEEEEEPSGGDEEKGRGRPHWSKGRRWRLRREKKEYLDGLCKTTDSS